MAVQDNSSIALIPSAYGTSKVYSVIPSNGNGDFTFSRSGNATRVNKGGYIETMGSNVPRLDYPLIDGVVQDCPALLLEPSRTNLVLESENFNNYFTKISSATITSNDIIAPDGSQSGDKLTKGTTPLCLRRSSQVSIGIQYAFSVYAKKGSVDKIQLDIGDAGVQEFTLTDKWQRFEVTATPPTFTHIDIEMPTGSSGDYIYLFGAQVEQGSYKTSYIKTSGSAITRSADVCNGSGTSAEFNDSEGVLFAEISAFDDTTKQLSISDGTTASAVKFLYLSGNIFAFQVRDSFATQVDIQKTLTDVNENIKAAAKYKSNDFSLWVNGFEIGTDTSGTVPSGLSELAYDDGGGGSNFYSKSKQLMTFKTALTDSELETLTSWDSFNAMAKGQLYTIE